MLEALDELGIKITTEIANKVYSTGELTDQMCQSVFITIPKIQGTLESKKHRTSKITNHLTLKIILRVIANRIRDKLRPEIAEEQYGFNRGKGAKNASFVIRTLADNIIEIQENVYVCIVDCEKVFDKNEI